MITATQVSPFATVRNRPRRTSMFLLLPAVLFIAIFLFVPIALLIVRSFSDASVGDPDILPLTGDNYAAILDSLGYYLARFGKTLLLSGLGSILGAIIAYPLALGIVSTRSWSLRFVYVFFALTPMLVSVVVRTFGWQIILGPTGPIGLLASGNNGFLSTDVAVVIGLGHLATPFILLSLLPVLDTLDPALIRAARGLGASSAQVLIKVVLAMSMPGLISGLIVSFSVGATVVVTPQLLGGRQNQLAANLIYDQMVQFFDWNLAAAISTLLMLMIGIVAFIVGQLESRFSPLARARRAVDMSRG